MNLQTKVRSGLLVVMLSACVVQAQAAQGLDEARPAAANDRFIPASTFVPGQSNFAYRYVGGGCVSAPNGTVLVHKLILPEGSILRYVRSYYLDVGSNAIVVYPTFYDAAGSFFDLGTIVSTDAPGYTTVLSMDFNHAIDSQFHAYAINAVFAGGADSIFSDGFEGESGVIFCGVRVSYD